MRRKVLSAVLLFSLSLAASPVQGDGGYFPPLRSVGEAAYLAQTRQEVLLAFYSASPSADDGADEGNAVPYVTYVLSSRYEGLPNVVLEALSMEVPVVSTRVGGVDDVVEDGQSGFIVETDAIDMMVARVRLLASDPDRRRQMGEHGREAVQNLTWAAINDELLGLYAALMTGRLPEVQAPRSQKPESREVRSPG